MHEQQIAKELAFRRRVAQVDSNESLGCLFCSSFTSKGTNKMTNKREVGGSKTAVVLAIALSILMLSARAETVAYWPLAYDNNVRTTTATAFDSIAGAGLTAHPYSLEDGEIVPGSDYCPVGTNAFPAGYGVYDPVGNVTRDAGTGLYFRTLSTSHDGYSGMLCVENPASLKLTTFTVECFVRRQSETPRNNSWNCVAVMPRQLMNGESKIKNCDAWGLRIVDLSSSNQDFGQLFLRFSPVDLSFESDGTSISGETKVYSGACENLYDGNWHHVAFSVDDSTHKVNVYFDYQLKTTVELGFSVTYGEAENLYLGATPQTAGPFGGSLAHFRISNEVLTPDKFLQFARSEAAATEDDDVLLHVNFNPVEGISTNGIAFNEAAKGSAVLRMTSTASAAEILCDDLPNENVRSSLIANHAPVNSGCMTNAYAQKATDYYQWFPGKDVFTNSSFTIECFYKTTGSQQYRSLIRRRGESNTQLMLGMNGARLRASVNSFAVDDVENSNDGVWHHGAAVYDLVQKKVLLFKDYRIVNALSYTSCPSSLANPLCIGGLDGTAGNRPSFGGQIDEARVTQRALTPGEFLTSDHFDSTSKTLGWVSFDNTLDSSMSSHALSNGVASAAAEDGMAPWYESFGNGEIFRFSDSSRTVLRRGDYASLACQTSSVLWASNPLLPLFADKTIEFFIKADSSKNVHDGAILRYGNGFSQNLSDSEIPGVYMAFQSGSSLKLRCGILKDTGDVYQTSSDENGINNDTGVVLADGRWHHVAVTIKHSTENEANYVTVSVYKDYAATPDWTKTVPGRLYEAGESRVRLGAASKYLNGSINELRISQGALLPNEFLRRWTTGLTLIFR